MTRIGSIFAFALVALLASLALVDARLPPVVATGGGVVQATPAPKPVYVRSEESSPAGGSTPQDLNDRADPATRAPLDDDEGAPTHATTTTTKTAPAADVVGPFTLRDDPSTRTEPAQKPTTAAIGKEPEQQRQPEQPAGSTGAASTRPDVDDDDTDGVVRQQPAQAMNDAADPRETQTREVVDEDAPEENQTRSQTQTQPQQSNPSSDAEETDEDAAASSNSNVAAENMTATAEPKSEPTSGDEGSAMKPPVGANAEVPANVTAQSKQTPAGTNASAEVIDAVQDAVVTPVRSDNASTTTATKDDDGGIDVVVEPRGGMSDAPEAVRYSDELLDEDDKNDDEQMQQQQQQTEQQQQQQTEQQRTPMTGTSEPEEKKASVVTEKAIVEENDDKSNDDKSAADPWNKPVAGSSARASISPDAEHAAKEMARAMGTSGAGEDRVSDELRARIVEEHGLSRVSPAGFETEAGQCGRSGSVALFTLWGTAPKETRDAIVSTFEGAAEGADGANVVDTWRGVFGNSVRVLGVYRSAFGGDDDAGRRGCVANFFVNSKIASGGSPDGSSYDDGSSSEDPAALRTTFLNEVLPADDARGDHDATVIALAVNCAASHRLRLLWKLYGAVVDRFGLTKNDAHLSAGDKQVDADAMALIGVGVNDLAAMRGSSGAAWARGTAAERGAHDACPRLNAGASSASPASTQAEEEDEETKVATKDETKVATKEETKVATKEEPASGAWKSQSEMERAFGAAEPEEMDPNPNPNPVRVENDRDVAYDRAREKVEARIDEREEKILRDFDGARYLR
jgi:hypothetical protein